MSTDDYYKSFLRNSQNSFCLNARSSQSGITVRKYQ